MRGVGTGFKTGSSSRFNYLRINIDVSAYKLCVSGFVMTARSTGREGDIVYLTSVRHNFSHVTALSFDFYIERRGDRDDPVGSLKASVDSTG